MDRSQLEEDLARIEVQIPEVKKRLEVTPEDQQHDLPHLERLLEESARLLRERLNEQQ